MENFQVLFKLLPEHEQLSEPRKKIPSRCVYKATSEVMNKKLNVYLCKILCKFVKQFWINYKLPRILICNRFEQQSNEIYFGIIHACIQVYVGSQWLIIVFQGQTEARLFHEWPKYFLHIGVQISFVLCHLYINKIYPLLT